MAKVKLALLVLATCLMTLTQGRPWSGLRRRRAISKAKGIEIPSYCVSNTIWTECLDTGECMLKEWRCDEEEDCKDGSDEKNCAPSCKPNEFQCSTFECVPKKKICDGRRDCPDGSDEKVCDHKKRPHGESDDDSDDHPPPPPPPRLVDDDHQKKFPMTLPTNFGNPDPFIHRFDGRKKRSTKRRYRRNRNRRIARRRMNARF